MKNIAGLMKQAQQMQQKMQDMQAEIEAMEIEGQAGGGLVKATLTGKGTAVALSIDSSLVSEGDHEMIEDLAVAAFNDAKAQADALMQDKMKDVTGGLNLPAGMKLPF
jgi:DNA-binding YbaB/EbfC family protein